MLYTPILTIRIQCLYKLTHTQNLGSGHEVRYEA